MSEPPAHLLDGNVLVALVLPEHVHHDTAEHWFADSGLFATCPTVQGTLLRLLIRQGTHVDDARATLAAIVAHPRHRQWSDDLRYLDVDLSHVLGHRQVTDAYLAQLARARKGRLATLDRGLAQAAADVADFILR